MFGAGKSATVLISYLLENAEKESWLLKLVDSNLELAKSKLKESTYGVAISFDINQEEQRKELISQVDLIISMLPPHLHFLVAKDCAKLGKHLLTASYLDENINSLSDEIKNKDVLFLCEMGLDPGIDHMSAMKIIGDIKEDGGSVHSFKSHCGGLVAPESDDNPWHYKISWNPRNILMAGQSGAHYVENKKEIKLTHAELFSSIRLVDIPELGNFAWYPNRDSASYSALYDLENAGTFIRTTLRHPEFILGWKYVLKLGLTDETKRYATDGKSLADFFTEHFSILGKPDKVSFQDWIKLNGNIETNQLEMILNQLLFLGIDDHETWIDKGFCSAADIMEFILQKKLALLPNDRDMIVMLHEIGYTLGSKKYEIQSCLIVKGENNLNTAMAKTVGLPLGIAAKLILNGRIKERGIHIPVSKEIYEPVLTELESVGIVFKETVKEIN